MTQGITEMNYLVHPLQASIVHESAHLLQVLDSRHSYNSLTLLQQAHVEVMHLPNLKSPFITLINRKKIMINNRYTVVEY